MKGFSVLEEKCEVVKKMQQIKEYDGQLRECPT